MGAILSALIGFISRRRRPEQVAQSSSDQIPKMSTVRRDQLVRIQAESQQKWDAARVFEEDAPSADSVTEKYLVTFPYPYCNGFLHIGHALTISKAEFAVSYKRL